MHLQLVLTIPPSLNSSLNDNMSVGGINLDLQGMNYQDRILSTHATYRRPQHQYVL